MPLYTTFGDYSKAVTESANLTPITESAQIDQVKKNIEDIKAKGGDVSEEDVNKIVSDVKRIQDKNTKIVIGSAVATVLLAAAGAALVVVKRGKVFKAKKSAERAHMDAAKAASHMTDTFMSGDMDDLEMDSMDAINAATRSTNANAELKAAKDAFEKWIGKVKIIGIISAALATLANTVGLTNMALNSGVKKLQGYKAELEAEKTKLESGSDEDKKKAKELAKDIAIVDKAIAAYIAQSKKPPVEEE